MSKLEKKFRELMHASLLRLYVADVIDVRTYEVATSTVEFIDHSVAYCYVNGVKMEPNGAR